MKNALGTWAESKNQMSGFTKCPIMEKNACVAHSSIIQSPISKYN